MKQIVFSLLVLGFLVFRAGTIASADITCPPPIGDITRVNITALENQGNLRVVESHDASCSFPVCGAELRCDLVSVTTGTGWGDGTAWTWLGPTYGGLADAVTHEYASGGSYFVSVEAIFSRTLRDGSYSTVTKTDGGVVGVFGRTRTSCNSSGQCVVGGDGASCESDADCPAPSTYGSLHVVSNIPASWTVTGTTGCADTCPGSGTYKRYNEQYGSYTVHPQAVPGFTTPPAETLTLSASGPVWFYLDYSATGDGPPPVAKYRCTGDGSGVCVRDDAKGPYTSSSTCRLACDRGATHKACIGTPGLCVLLEGPGPDTCQTNVDCGDGPGYCGDNVCDPGETSVTCIQDCPIPACRIGATPSRLIVPPPKFSTLSWDCSATANCSLDQGIGPVNPAGSHQVMPTSSTLYTLTCADASATTSIRVFDTSGGTIREVRP